MSKVKCYSVRLKTLTSISDKCFKACDFNGNEDFVPKSQVFEKDINILKSDAYWISEWILEKKNLQYSYKKEAWFDSDSGIMLPTYTIENHKPTKINPVEKNICYELIK